VPRENKLSHTEVFVTGKVRHAGDRLGRADFERRLSDCGDLVLCHQREQFHLDTPVRDVVHHLIDAHEVCKPCVDNLPYPVRVEIADPESADLALIQQGKSTLQRLFERYRSGPMQQVKVNMIGLRSVTR